MVGLSALWMPIVVSAVFVLIALLIIHGLVGWHKGDMTAVPGETKVMETLRGLNVQPGDYRFPHGNTVEEMTTPEFVEKMKQGPVGVMSIWPNGEINMGKLLGQWFIYSLLIAVLAAYVTGRTRAAGAPYLEVRRARSARAARDVRDERGDEERVDEPLAEQLAHVDLAAWPDRHGAHRTLLHLLDELRRCHLSYGVAVGEAIVARLHV